MSKKSKTHHTPNLCQCEPPAVSKPPTRLRTKHCTVCGKLFKTNRKEDICISCRKKPESQDRSNSNKCIE